MLPHLSTATGLTECHASPSLPLGLELQETRGIFRGRLLGRTGCVKLRNVVREAEHCRSPLGPADPPLAAGRRTDHHSGSVNLMENLEILPVRTTNNCDILLIGRVPH